MKNIETLDTIDSSQKVEKIFFGGTTVPKHLMRALYYNVVADVESEIPVDERLIALPSVGLIPIEKTLSIVRKKVARLRDMHPDSRFILAGHSQGGVVANELGLEGLANAVVSYAAPDRGVDYKKDSQLTRSGLLGWKALELMARRNIQLPPAIRDMHYESDFMQDHVRRMATEWPEHVPRYAVAAHHDGIVPIHSVLGATPDSVDWMVAPRSTWTPENVTLFHDKSTNHLDLTLTKASREIMRQMQWEVTEGARIAA